MQVFRIALRLIRNSWPLFAIYVLALSAMGMVMGTSVGGSVPSDEAYQDGLRAFARTVSQDAASDWLYSCRTFVAAQPRLSGYATNMADRWLPLTDIALS